ncbi:MAG: hypothetical protein QOG53_3119 [Frankiales bacterium]|jgi:hypothetical protein|nr:hypothetical protein [Frankiales bacterium]
MRRLISITAIIGTMLVGIVVGASPARADICTFDFDGSGPLPSVSVPCPGPEWQPPVPVAVVSAQFGPGYGQPLWYLHLYKGGRIFFENDINTGGQSFHGTGFDSGVVGFGQMAEVSGVPSLGLGQYAVYDMFNRYVGRLYIEPIPGCAGPDGC